MKFKEMRKALVALGVVVVEAVYLALKSGEVALPVDTPLMPVIISALGAALVYLVRNDTKDEN